MNHVVDKNTYKVLNKGAGDHLEAVHLGEDIAIACSNVSLSRVGICRTDNLDAIMTFMAEMLEGSAGDMRGILRVRLVGGVANEVSRKTLENTVMALNAFDADQDIVDIISADILGKPHPAGFQLRVSDGAVIAVE